MYCSFVFKVCLLILIDSVTVSHFHNQFLVEETSFPYYSCGFFSRVRLVVVYFPVWPIILVSYSLSKSLIGHTKSYLIVNQNCSSIP